MQRQIDSQRREFENQLAAMRDLLDERYASQTKAIDTLATATDKRFDGVNEFRAQQGDLIRTFMPRQESLSRHDQTAAAIQALSMRHDSDVAVVNKRLDLTQGASTGLDKAWAYLVAAVVLAATVVGIVMAVAR